MSVVLLSYLVPWMSERFSGDCSPQVRIRGCFEASSARPAGPHGQCASGIPQVTQSARTAC
jgi:hypothetical protein